ncbi:hypothetical protein [Methylobrevis albus]|uniref:Uncharacterized protein n=1 Tax=Methylobrevis albus TaxID=2793297 RepID=A0A931I320_9HYPH|nr:hypothetical protein [Methylobrevis albus]MBH0238383.1 hypothetical protein [Methylobrevis albus]
MLVGLQQQSAFRRRTALSSSITFSGVAHHQISTADRIFLQQAMLNLLLQLLPFGELLLDKLILLTLITLSRRHGITCSPASTIPPVRISAARSWPAAGFVRSWICSPLPAPDCRWARGRPSRRPAAFPCGARPAGAEFLQGDAAAEATNVNLGCLSRVKRRLRQVACRKRNMTATIFLDESDPGSDAAEVLEQREAEKIPVALFDLAEKLQVALRRQRSLSIAPNPSGNQNIRA